jgi:hypothetical protein
MAKIWKCATITIFGPNVVTISARNTICELCKLAIFSAFYNISQPNFTIAILLIL